MGLVIGTGGIHIGTSGGGASPVKRFDAEAEYIKRKAGGTDNIGTGKAKIPTLKGKSVVWNQLKENGNFDGTNKWACVNGSMSTSNNVITISITGTGAVLYNPIEMLANHRYLMMIDVFQQESGEFKLSTNIENGRVNIQYSGEKTDVGFWVSMYRIFSFSSISGQTQFQMVFRNKSVGNTVKAKNALLFDLTQMFGAGNEPSTVAEFEAMYPLPYYDYNEGEIINNAAEAIETVGFNQLNMEGRTEYDGTGTPDTVYDFLTENMVLRGWASNGYLNGLTIASYSILKGLITIKTSTAGNSASYGVGLPVRVFPGMGYYVNTTGGKTSITWISAGGAIISNVKAERLSVVTAPANTMWAVVGFYPDAVNTEKSWSNVNFNLSDAARNGQYEPYEKHTLQLGLGSFDVKDSEDNVITVNGLKSAGSAFDEIDLARGKYIKRVGEVDLGTLTWTKFQSDGVFYSQTLQSLIAKGEVSKGIQVITDKYMPITSRGLGYVSDYDKICSIETGYKTFFIKDSSYSDSTKYAFKTAMSGVTLYYELAEPVEYDLVTPVGNSYKVISGGTEERLPRDTASSVMAPIKYSVKYVQPKE